MLHLIRQAWRGAGYLEGYGHHPGWATLLIFIFCAGLAGIDKGGLRGFLGGLAVGIVAFGIPFIIGCVDRANGCDRAQARIINHLRGSK